MDCSPPGSSVHGSLQARILEWVAILFSRASSQPRDQTRVSLVSCIGRRVLYHCATWEAILHEPSTTPGRTGPVCSLSGTEHFCRRKPLPGNVQNRNASPWELGTGFKCRAEVSFQSASPDPRWLHNAAGKPNSIILVLLQTRFIWSSVLRWKEKSKLFFFFFWNLLQFMYPSFQNLSPVPFWLFSWQWLSLESYFCVVIRVHFPLNFANVQVSLSILPRKSLPSWSSR